jgi:hypothetical protein
MNIEHNKETVLRDGLVHEHYACRDDIEMMRQLGLLPPASCAEPDTPARR